MLPPQEQFRQLQAAKPNKSKNHFLKQRLTPTTS
jgi:hypothetical protein